MWVVDSLNLEAQAASDYNVREKRRTTIETMKIVKIGQNMSKKEKTALKNLIKNKVKSIVVNDAIKNIDAADA